MSLAARAVILALIVTAAIAGWWRLTTHFENKGYTRAQAEAREVADAQAQRNRELQRAAEKRYTVATEVRERVITEIVTEVRHEAASLAVCPVPEPVRGLLNAARACASEDRPASGGPCEPLPDAR